MAATVLKYPFIDGYKYFPKDKDNDVREIRKWLQTQPHLPQLNEDYLHLFLHCNYYNLEETKSNILAFFSLRSTSPELFLERSLLNPTVQVAIGYSLFGMVPKRTPEGYQVVVMSLKSKNISEFVHVDFVKTMFMFFDIMVSEYGLCPGYIVVYDSHAFNLSMFLKINFGAVMKIAKYFQEAAPVRVKNVIVVNSVSFVDKLFAISSPFLKSSLVSKLQFYATGNDLTNLYKTVPRDCIFEEYGGTCGSIMDAHENYMSLLENKYSKWIEDESIYKVDNTKKPEPAKRSFFSFW